MSKIAYRKISLNKTRRERLSQINAIIEEYLADGYRMTLRQLYYQLVSRDFIPNSQLEYRKISDILTEGRMAGIVDWDAIVDRGRNVRKKSSWNSPSDILEAVIKQYEKPRQDGQKTYVEVWVEKDALSEIIEEVATTYHIPVMVNKGYSSVTAMHEAFQRFRHAAARGMKIRIIYLGDFDPSGRDMIRDIEGRTREFAAGHYGEQLGRFNFEIDAVALTMDQIRQYEPPPQPAKKQDPRADAFIAEHGDESWELDALSPKVLNDIIETGIKKYINIAQYNRVLIEERKDRLKLESLLPHLEEDDDDN